MSDPLSEARVRTQRYWLRDGLEEIHLGIVFLLMGGWSLAIGTSWFVPASVIYMLLAVAFIKFVPRIKAAMRERITYPRSGYAHYDEARLKRRRVLAAVFAVVVLYVVTAFVPRYIVSACLHPARVFQWLTVVAGIFFGAVSVYVWVRHGLLRWLVVGAFATILGVAVSIHYPPSQYPRSLAWAIFVTGLGCAFLCSGGAALWNYRRTPPASAQET